MNIIQNNFLRVTSKSDGAELTSIYHNQHHIEYLWQAENAWPKHAPVLFPIVGQLKDNTFFYEGKPYHLDRHGFARTSKFVLHEQSTTHLLYRLQSNVETLKCYPFQFVFDIKYELADDTLIVSYIVQNSDDKELLFSVGAHPAFKVPLFENESYHDYFLEFEKEENADRWLIDNGLINDQSTPFLKNTNTILLQKQLFYDDALVFKNLASKSICIKNKTNTHGLQMNFKGFPYFGIWAAKDADFLCLEPWQGIADPVSTCQQLKSKEGMMVLKPNQISRSFYSITFF